MPSFDIGSVDETWASRWGKNDDVASAPTPSDSESTRKSSDAAAADRRDAFLNSAPPTAPIVAPPGIGMVGFGAALLTPAYTAPSGCGRPPIAAMSVEQLEAEKAQLEGVLAKWTGTGAAPSSLLDRVQALQTAIATKKAALVRDPESMTLPELVAERNDVAALLPGAGHAAGPNGNDVRARVDALNGEIEKRLSAIAPAASPSEHAEAMADAPGGLPPSDYSDAGLVSRLANLNARAAAGAYVTSEVAERGRLSDELARRTRNLAPSEAARFEGLKAAANLGADLRLAQGTLSIANATNAATVRPSVSTQQWLTVGALAIPIAKVADALAAFVPIAGQALILAEAATGRELGGLGEPTSAEARALSAALVLIPEAGKLLAAGREGAAVVADLARQMNRTPEEVGTLLISLHTMERDAPALRDALAAAQAGRALTADESAAVGRFRAMYTDFGGVTSAQSRAALRAGAVSIGGQGAAVAQLRDATAAYAEAVKSNQPWRWERDIPGGAALTKAQRAEIKKQAIASGLIPNVAFKPGTRFPDFAAAGLVLRFDTLPQELWSQSDAKQFAWLDARVPGGRPAGTTWHHTETPGCMELVPFGIHNIINHEGGRSPRVGWASGGR